MPRLLIHDLGYYWLVFLAFILGRYFLLAGGASWLFTRASRAAFLQLSISRARRLALIRQDIILSVSAAVLFALLAAVMMLAYLGGHTRLYSDVSQYGWWYIGVSFAATLLLQDAYFYATHRLLHHPWLFRRIHRGHHASPIPTPWTSFAFEPSETLVHGIFFVGLLFVLPLHIGTLMAVFITMTLWAIATHLGFELIPAGAPLPWLRRGLIGPVHHGIHHRQYNRHYGLYFTFWDWVGGTADPVYGRQDSP